MSSFILMSQAIGDALSTIFYKVHHSVTVMMGVWYFPISIKLHACTYVYSNDDN